MALLRNQAAPSGTDALPAEARSLNTMCSLLAEIGLASMCQMVMSFMLHWAV